MSATSFLRQRRAVAAKYVEQQLKRKPALVREVLERNNLDPEDLSSLAGNNDVLSIADELAKGKLGEDELDTLEELNTLTTGDRAAVHGDGVRADQFEDKLQHPAQETVGVGNMHDGPQEAEALANVSQARVDANDGSLADAAAERAAEDDGLASHSGLPANAPSLEPAAQEVTGDQPIEEQIEAGSNADDPLTPETPVDRQEAADALKELEVTGERLAAAGEKADAFADMDATKMRAYAAEQGFKLSNHPNTKDETLRASLREQQAAKDEAAR